MMARIPEREIERIKQSISLEQLAEASGIALKRHGADLIGLCPFHEDHAPSLVVSPDKNLWHCLGACQCGGTVIDWVMKREGISFRHAVEWLRTDYPALAADHSNRSGHRSKAPRVSLDLHAHAEEQALLGQVIDYYHGTLKENPEALAYLDKRGLNDPELIATFKLGFANRTLGYRLPYRNTASQGGIRTRLQQIGLLRSSGHEHFTGCVVIPVMDLQGRITEVYGRKINDHLRKGTAYHLYLPGPHRGIFNPQALVASKEIILCESLIDALTFWAAGFRNVTASYGVTGFTQDHLTAFKTHGTERVLIAYDRDAAGDVAADKLATQLLAEGIGCSRLHFPKGMDANDYACQVTPASKSLGVVLRSAVWLGNNKPLSHTVTTEPAAKDQNTIPESTSSLVAEPSVPSPTSAAQSDIRVSDHEVHLSVGNRHYRVRGLEKNHSIDQLKINLRVLCEDVFYVDTLELYAARARQHYIQQAAKELGTEEDVIKRDLGRLLRTLEDLQDRQIEKTLQVKPVVELSECEKTEALALLRDPHLIDRITQDVQRAGLVGEDTNALVGYLCGVSRKLTRPLALLIQSTSAAGKSALLEAMLAMMPGEDKVQYSALTGQSLYYLGSGDLKHKILAIAEEEGASQAAYALKLLQSEGQLTIASTGKDPQTGNLETQEYHVEGPVMLALTTTAIDIDEELLNRCLVLTVNEDRTQTQAIHQQQRRRRTLAGLLAQQDQQHITKVHQNAQRLLRPLAVVNPYAQQLTFLDHQTRTRRDHDKYLTLIDAIALLHQYQRPIQSVQHQGELIEYVAVTLADIRLANRLAHDVLGRTLDECPPQTRRLLARICEYVKGESQRQSIAQCDYRFSRKQLREATGWGDTQLKIHLQRLVELEHLVLHRQGPRYHYELLYDGTLPEQPHVNGLLDVKTLQTDYDANRSGQQTPRSGSGRPPVGAPSGGGHTATQSEKSNGHKPLPQTPVPTAEKHVSINETVASYAGQDVPVPRAHGCARAARNP